MSQWIHEIPNFGIGALIIACGLVLTTIAPMFIRKRFGWNPSEHWVSGADDGFKLFTSLSLMILAFCLVSVQGDRRNIEDLVSREGTVIGKLHRAMGSYGGPEAIEMQKDLKNYAERIIKVEWPLLAGGQHDPELTLMLSNLTKMVRTLNADTPAKQLARVELVGTLAQLSDVRDARLAAIHVKLPAYYYHALTFTLLGVMLFGWFQTPLRKMAVVVGGITAGLGLMLTLLVVNSAHFLGESSVSPMPILRAMEGFGS